MGNLFLGRFGEEVIKRRMLVGQDLLNFIGQRHYLVASRPFQQFFQVSSSSSVCVCVCVCYIYESLNKFLSAFIYILCFFKPINN